ncbi:uncharacterized protein [Macrobrachium rosenbergii]|uniref:uncharacterized protein isoform X5 n=1 Tax=Macrobrachium rosenbergii TaxID=79674 RepID=UPI0034D6249D
MSLKIFDTPPARKKIMFTKTLFRKISYVMLYLPPPVFKFLLWSSRTLKYVHASDKILGIRSPERVIEVFEESQNALNDTALSPAVLARNASHLLQKRHIPHKFWARARPHNKFRKKKRLQKLKQENLDGNEKLFHKGNADGVRYNVIKSGNIR